MKRRVSRAAGRRGPDQAVEKSPPAVSTPAPKPGRPRIEDRDKTLAAKKPWEEAGMSRASWYRRQRGKA